MIFQSILTQLQMLSSGTDAFKQLKLFVSKIFHLRQNHQNKQHYF